MHSRHTLTNQAIEQTAQNAQQFLQRGEHDRYLQLMEQAAGMDPANHRVPIDVAVSYLRRYDYPSARKWFDRAVAGSPIKVDVLESVAFYCRNLLRYDLAEEYLEQAAALPGATANTFAKLADMYERSRKTDQANQAVQRALQLEPGNAMALLEGARLERSAGRLDSGEKLARAVIARQDPRLWSARIRAWYELGANLDQQGRYDEAMAAFIAGKTADVPEGFRGLDALAQKRQSPEQTAAALTEPLLRRWSEQARSGRHCNQPMAVLCGHPRSGTTLLEQILDAHPKVVALEETTILADACKPLLNTAPTGGLGLVSDLDGFTPDAVERQRRWYFDSVEKFLGQPVGGRLLIDKNPAFTGNLPEVLRFFPDIRLIVALRDPRDVCLSCFMQPLPLNPISSRYLMMDATAKEYAAIMGFWLAIKPRLLNPVLEIRYEDVVANPELQSRRVLEFLDLDWDPGVLQYHERARQKLVRSPSYNAVAKPISNRAVGRWKNYEKFMFPISRILEPYIKAFGYEN
jgi:Tfp pilus assembly protein PilF